MVAGVACVVAVTPPSESVLAHDVAVTTTINAITYFCVSGAAYLGAVAVIVAAGAVIAAVVGAADNECVSGVVLL